MFKTVKTTELSGAVLDWAVGRCYQVKTTIKNGRVWLDDGVLYFPSVYWGQGGPIIEMEKIDVNSKINAGGDVDEWRAIKGIGAKTKARYGPTPLIAAMRCYVASKLGDEVEIPQELL